MVRRKSLMDKKIEKGLQNARWSEAAKRLKEEMEQKGITDSPNDAKVKYAATFLKAHYPNDFVLPDDATQIVINIGLWKTR